MVEQSKPTSLFDFIGKPIQEVQEHPYFKGHPFEKIPSKTGNPKGNFYTCKAKEFQAFCLESSQDQLIDYIDVYNK